MLIHPAWLMESLSGICPSAELLMSGNPVNVWQVASLCQTSFNLKLLPLSNAVYVNVNIDIVYVVCVADR